MHQVRLRDLKEDPLGHEASFSLNSFIKFPICDRSRKSTDQEKPPDLWFHHDGLYTQLETRRIEHEAAQYLCD
jgi:hypothetical protein